MDLVILLLLVVILSGSKFFWKNYNNDSFSIDQTKSISGIFVFLVFIRHFIQYIEVQSHDKVLVYLDGFAQQLIVVPFLFFSGYAIMLNIEKDRKMYLHKLPRKMLLLWIHFVLGVFIFLALNCIMGQKHSFNEIVLSIFGMQSIGNSTWYIVAIIFLWIFTYISFKIFKKNVVSFSVLASMILLYAFGFNSFKGEIWYNTVIAYYLGMLFGKLKPYIDAVISNKQIIYWSLLFGSLLIVIFQTNTAIYLFEIRVIFFTIFIVLFCYKVRINNSILQFLGKYVFEIYLLQRLPMIVLKHLFKYNLLYFAICFLITIVLAIMFKKITSFIDRRVFVSS